MLPTKAFHTTCFPVLAFFEYGSVGICAEHMNSLAGLFGLVASNPAVQSRSLATLWERQENGWERMTRGVVREG